ncbi:hypothetical protein L3Q82_020114, partial [Scortum barcoo]
TKLKALKSCLVCLVSYCETHLEPHLTVSVLKRHQLMEPVENLEGRMYHKTHDVVLLKEEYEEKKAKLGKTEAEIQQMIQERRLKIEEIKRSVDLTEEDADREIAEGVQVFTSLKESVQKGLNELIHTIKEKKETEKHAQAFIKELEQEISELMKRRTEVEEVSQSEDHLHLLQNVQSLNIHHLPPTKDWTEVSVRPSYDGTVRRAVAQLEETLSKEMNKLVEAELKKVQQYAVDVTLDPDTAHPGLILSEDGKQVKGKTEWDLGVARESVNRKEDTPLSPDTGYWTIWLRNGNEYEALDDPDVSLSLKSRPQKCVDMATVSCQLSEDQFLCSICLDVFTVPVSTPCGHNFCKNCITEHWNINHRCQCPICKEAFTTRPVLKVNTLFSEMVAQFKSAQQEASSSSSSEQQESKPGEVPCDVCTGTKLKALKSCLVCLVSYCETHLEPHLTVSFLKRHQLMEPVENLEGRMCTKHDKPLELFCKTDQTYVCMLCSVLDHKTHEFVPLKEGYEGKKAVHHTMGL